MKGKARNKSEQERGSKRGKERRNGKKPCPPRSVTGHRPVPCPPPIIQPLKRGPRPRLPSSTPPVTKESTPPVTKESTPALLTPAPPRQGSRRTGVGEGKNKVDTDKRHGKQALLEHFSDVSFPSLLKTHTHTGRSHPHFRLPN